MNKYYIVTCKCGHVGRRYYLPVAFPIKADNGKEAAFIGRSISRVKHDHKDAILSCDKVSYNEFLSQIEKNSKFKYLKCKSRHEQNKIEGLKDLLEVDHHNDVIRYGTRNKEFIMKRNKELVGIYESEIQNYFIEEYYEEDL